jgi:hypothetical protein
MVVRRVFGLMREEVRRGWRKVHNVELHNLYALPREGRMIWAGYIVQNIG